MISPENREVKTIFQQPSSADLGPLVGLEASRPTYGGVWGVQAPRKREVVRVGEKQRRGSMFASGANWLDSGARADAEHCSDCSCSVFSVRCSDHLNTCSGIWYLVSDACYQVPEHLFRKPEHLFKVSEHLFVFGEHCSGSALAGRL